MSATMMKIDAVYAQAKKAGAEVAGVDYSRVSEDGRRATAEIMIVNPDTQAVAIFTAAGNTAGPFVPESKLTSAFNEIGLGFGSGK